MFGRVRLWQLKEKLIQYHLVSGYHELELWKVQEWKSLKSQI